MTPSRRLPGTIAIIAVILGCAAQHPAQPVRVCIEMPTLADNDEAWRAIQWWHESVEHDCSAGAITVHAGTVPPDSPDACGWTDGAQIVWVCAPVFDVVRHEFGHILGYEDAPDGVMASGSAESPL